MINYFSKCFSYAISQNVGEPENLRANLKCIVPHAFGNHAMCDIFWCGLKKESPVTYKHSDLPNGKDLQGEPLQRALNELLSEYTTDVVISKLSSGANSQRNERLNSIIASRNPKTRFYGGSESNDFRVACAVAQTTTMLVECLKFLTLNLGIFVSYTVTQWKKRLTWTEKESQTRNSSTEGVSCMVKNQLKHFVKKLKKEQHMGTH